MEELLNKLNPQQYKAVINNNDPLLVLAGAGSGKTTLLTVKFAYLVKKEGANPSKIFAVTFTNKAANEMKERIIKITNYNRNFPWITTFHSFGAKVLRRFIDKLGYKSDFIIYDDTDQKNFLKKLIKNDLNLDEKRYPPQKAAYFINSFKNEAISPEEADIKDNNWKILYSFYQKKMKENNTVDFGDLLYLTYKLFMSNQEVLDYFRHIFDYILVDEYQDTNSIQYKIIKLLSQPKRKICAVGDDDQSIYGWRGANIRNILNFEKDFPNAKIVKLEENYRSTQIILDAANNLISKNKNRKGKNLWTTKGKGEKITLFEAFDEYEEANFVVNTIMKLEDYSKCAILYRTNAQSRVFEDTLVKNNIPYTIVGGFKFFDRKEIKDIIAYLKLVNGSEDILAYERVINTPPRGIGAKTFGKLIQLSNNQNVSLYNILKSVSNGEIKFPPKIKNSLTNFFNILSRLRELNSSIELSELTSKVIEFTKYLSIFENIDPIERENRVANLEELISSIKHFEESNPDATLTDYLDSVSLTSAVDVKFEGNSVTLMTIHSAKGLEFPYIFLTGVEDNILPHINSKFNEMELEEERRLCYVAITRAKHKLYISYSQKRGRGRVSQYNMPSPFLQDIPMDLIENYNIKSRYEYEKHEIEKDRNFHIKPKTDNNLKVKSGMLVNHRKFGIGKIIAIIGADEGQKVVIYFKNFGKKTLNIDKAPIQFL